MLTPLTRIAVTGADGQLGAELVRQLGSTAIPLARCDFDITDAQGTYRSLTGLAPDAVIHCAAWTRVDAAERDPFWCRRVNFVPLTTIVEACQKLNCPLVFVSTNHVFGGMDPASRPFRETDALNPLNVFGRVKCEAERYVATSLRRHIIIRTCGLYEAPEYGRRSFLSSLLSLAPDAPPVGIVDDEFCTPSHTREVARAILFLLQHAHHGTYHITSGGRTTWYRFAVEAFQIRGLSAPLVPISSRDLPRSARRPRFSVLSTAKYMALGGPPLPHWREALRNCLTGLATPDGHPSSALP